MKKIFVLMEGSENGLYKNNFVITITGKNLPKSETGGGNTQPKEADALWQDIETYKAQIDNPALLHGLPVWVSNEQLKKELELLKEYKYADTIQTTELVRGILIEDTDKYVIVKRAKCGYLLPVLLSEITPTDKILASTISYLIDSLLLEGRIDCEMTV